MRKIKSLLELKKIITPTWFDLLLHKNAQIYFVREAYDDAYANNWWLFDCKLGYTTSTNYNSNLDFDILDFEGRFVNHAEAIIEKYYLSDDVINEFNKLNCYE